MALYDYQAAADDEISFDPNDVITNIEMVRKDYQLILISILLRGFFMLLSPLKSEQSLLNRFFYLFLKLVVNVTELVLL